MISLMNLVLIECEKDKNGKKTFRRLDTKEIVHSDYIDVLKEPPMILQFKPHEKLNPTINLPINYSVLSANALLIGDRMQEEYDDYYAASFCRINKKE